MLDMKSSSEHRTSLRRSCLISTLLRRLLSSSISLRSSEMLSGRLSLSEGRGKVFFLDKKKLILKATIFDYKPSDSLFGVLVEPSSSK